MSSVTRHRFDQLATLAKCLRQVVHVDKLNPLLCFDMKKSDILKCPNRYFNGKIFIISSEKDERKPEVVSALKRLSTSKYVGFDTETAVDWNERTNNNPVSLVQLACEDTAVLWRLRGNDRFLREKFPDSLKVVLKNPDVRKVGTASARDVIDLYSHYDVIVSNIVDNQTIAKEIGLSRVGLSSMTAQLFGWGISKARRLSNWEASFLDRSQAIYAATDAWASLLVYKKLESMVITISGGSPSSLPSIDEQQRAQDTSIDLKLFRSLDSKIMHDSLPASQLNLLFQNKHQRLQKRKSKKMNMSMDDMDIDAISTIWREIEVSPSEYLNVENKTIIDTLKSTLIGSRTMVESPFLYQAEVR